jgi:tripeptide aminopeptidase
LSTRGAGAVARPYTTDQAGGDVLDPREVQQSDAFRTARSVVHETDAVTVAHMEQATAIPAPMHGEAARSRWLAERLRELGLEPVTDAIGNVIAVAPSLDRDAPRVVIASHLDTVFAADTPLEFVRDGARVSAPGISDNARGLAGLLAIARALHAADWPTRAPVTFVGTVGEEGAGDLRGAKHFMAEHGSTTGVFIALDGAGDERIIHAGVGSRRLRATFRGPGGHSWSDWGAPNAIHAAGRALAALLQVELPPQPRTTLTVARIGGGTSINAIAAEAWFELDLRSEAREPLLELESRVREALQRATDAEGGAGGMECDVVVFGDRPAGATAPHHPLVSVAVEATRAIGREPVLTSSSTDANVAMAAGIPAIGMGAGGEAGGTHTPGEWYDNVDGPAGIERALLVVLAAAGLR